MMKCWRGKAFRSLVGPSNILKSPRINFQAAPCLLSSATEMIDQETILDSRSFLLPPRPILELQLKIKSLKPAQFIIPGFDDENPRNICCVCQRICPRKHVVKVMHLINSTLQLTYCFSPSQAAQRRREGRINILHADEVQVW
jgi:hypothetical protein